MPPSLASLLGVLTGRKTYFSRYSSLVSRNIRMLSDRAQDQVKILRETKLFIGKSDLDVWDAKRQLYLAMIGIKPVTVAGSSYWQEVPGGRVSVPHDEAQVGSLLDSLGLHYRIERQEYATFATVSRVESLLDFHDQNYHDVRVIGLLLGYPASAVMAYAAGSSLSIEDQDALLRKAGMREFSPFRFSKAWYRTELEVLRSWNDTVRSAGFE